MATLMRQRPATGTGLQADPSWSRLYWAGGVCALLAGLMYVVAVVVEFTVPAAPTSGGAAMLDYIASHRSTYILQQVLWLAPSILLTVVFLALYPALKGLDKSYAAIGAVLGIASWAVTLAYPATGGGAPALVYLSDQYAAAAPEAQRAAFAAAAEGFIALNFVATLMGVLETAAIAIVSVVMLKGVFHRGVAYLGFATGVIGVASEALKPILGIGYIVYGLLVMVWIIAIGWELVRLARASEGARRVGVASAAVGP
ncbi:MAG: hypothetical protein IRY97_12335 [Thermomicrobiaceae bacterium]|nr:hypothetical protein [Thermomicrobiaceae bacterium]